MFAGFYGSGCWKSTDYGVSWSDTSIPSGYVTGLAFDTNNDLYASTNGDSIMTDNGVIVALNNTLSGNSATAAVGTSSTGARGAIRSS
ncbi:MAG: hypothetical protein ABR961_12195 [Thermoanaerobaculaceae bacterium]